MSGQQAAWIELDGAVNVRDVGGLPTIDGRVTRSGVLMRADNLQDLTEADVSHLLTVRLLRTVIDLRSSGELHLEGPSPLQATAVRHHHLSLIPEYAGESDLVEVDRAVPTRAHRAGASRTDMSGYYIGYLQDAPRNVAAALRLLADADTGAAVVHCAAGKDRTGTIVALALSLVGVTREAVVADYVRSAERVDRVLDRLKASTTYAADLAHSTVDDVRPVAGSIERLLDHVDAEYGGVHGLAMAIGVDEQTVARLGARLVGTSPRTH